jgi:hypothetical protein
MWSEVEREVNKQLHNKLASLKAMILDVMANLDREVVIHVCKKFQSWIEVIWRPLGFSSNECVIYMNINLSGNFHHKFFTLTISFIVLNASIEFVLIYRPHPVLPVLLYIHKKGFSAPNSHPLVGARPPLPPLIQKG